MLICLMLINFKAISLNERSFSDLPRMLSHQKSLVHSDFRQLHEFVNGVNCLAYKREDNKLTEILLLIWIIS